MRLQSVTLQGFKSFANKTQLDFTKPVTAIVGPNGSGKSNIVEAIRFVLGEQSTKSMRGGNTSDLIFRGSQKVSRAVVNMVFDNSDRVFALTGNSGAALPLDYDQIEISRQVYKDGTAGYLLNGSKVRLKDLVELLASVHIGSSSHQVISQGSADRLLHASAGDRREMIEDALGLKVLRLKLKETRRKLERSHDHVKEVEALRNELKPYLSHLEREMKRIEKGRVLRESLVSSFLVYHHQSIRYVEQSNHTLRLGYEKLTQKKQDLELEYQGVQKEIALREEMLQSNELVDLQENHKCAMRDFQTAQNELFQIENESRNSQRILQQATDAIERYGKDMDTLAADKQAASARVSSKIVLEGSLLSEFQAHVNDLKKALGQKDISVISRLFTVFDSFLKSVLKTTSVDTTSYDVRLDVLKSRIQEEESRMKNALATFEGFVIQQEELKKRVEIFNTEVTRTEAAISTWNQQQKDSVAALQVLQKQLQALHAELLTTNQRISETQKQQALLGDFEEDLARDFHHVQQVVGEDFFTEQQQIFNAEGVVVLQESGLRESRKDIERLLIRFEHIGFAPNPQLEEEYTQAVDRDAFLQKELSDVQIAAEALAETVVDLQGQLVTVFDEGVLKVQGYFTDFIAQMFGGGSASLEIVSLVKPTDDENEDEGGSADTYLLDDRGVEVSVNLPKKAIKKLSLLSGGERSLVSIALLFALAHVNPPPFLVLDETDAALDEANSRRYGAMVRYVAQTTQLVVVTHNRETMSQADVLFGITMNQSGVSQMVHVDMEKALNFAK